MRPSYNTFIVATCALNFLPASGIPQAAKGTYCAKQLAPIGRGPRQEHSVVASGDNIYILAGLRGTTFSATGQRDLFTPDVEVYNTVNNSWSAIAPLPLPGHHINVAAVDGKLYYLGGLYSSGESIFNSQTDAKSLRYDPAVGKWEPIAEMPDARGSAAMGVYGKTIYLAGGLSGSMRSSDLFSSYDTVANKWTSHPNLKLPEARDHAGSTVVDGIFYLVGGRQSANLQNWGTVLTLDLKTLSSNSKWTTKSPMPTPRGGLAAAEAGGKIYTFGGEGNRNNAKGVFPNVEVYDIAKDTWEVAQGMAIPRHGFGAASLGGRVYVPGGGASQGGGGALDVNESYGPCY